MACTNRTLRLAVVLLFEAIKVCVLQPMTLPSIAIATMMYRPLV